MSRTVRGSARRSSSDMIKYLPRSAKTKLEVDIREVQRRIRDSERAEISLLLEMGGRIIRSREKI